MSKTPRPSSATLSRRTLVDVLRWRAEHQPDRIAYTFLLDGETREDHLTYGELDCRARAIAARLLSVGTRDERALLLYPPGFDYIAAFFACLYAGIVAVPAYPPTPNKPMPRIEAIVADAQPGIVLTTTQFLASMQRQLSNHPSLSALPWITTDDNTVDAESQDTLWRPHRIGLNDLAFLQYTSGSTASPRGVMVSHGNLIHNQHLVQDICEHNETSTFVSWLPMYHDLGLIGNVLHCLFIGARCVLMSPVAFLQKPLRWLQAISRYNANTSGGPNFAYDLCTRQISDEQKATLDLRQWRVAFAGAEPVRHATLQRFAEAFAPCGFRPEAFFASYGLAEATLMVSGPYASALPVVRSFDQAALEHNRAVVAPDSTHGARTLVSSGHILSDQRVAIVDPNTLVPCPPGQVGEIWVSGRSVARGYWQRPEQTAETFQARLSEFPDATFLRTGDLGFLDGGELFITGRLKDLIIIRGNNHYPQDIELTIEQSHASLRPGAGAAFSVEIAGEERLVVVQEVDRHFRQLDLADVAATVRQAIAREHQLQAHAVVLLRPGTIPKTSSGKIQRRECCARFLAGTLDAVYTAVLDDAEAATADETAFAMFTMETILQTPAEARQALLTSYLARQVAEALRVSASQIKADTPLSGLLDSLTAIEVRNTIELALSIDLPIVSLLDNHTPAQLASEILTRLDAAAPAQPAPVPLVAAPAPVDHADYPLSYGQQSLWFLHQLAPDSAAYNLPGAIRLRGPLHASALRRAFQMLMERHAALRTSFAAERVVPVQRVATDPPLPFREEDATAWSEAQLAEALHEEADRPFDLTRAPLFRVVLYRRSPREHILLLATHHIIADFWSLAVLLHELDVLYTCARTGQPDHLPPLPLRYTDFAHWQAEMLAGPEGEQHWAYWQRELSGELPTLDLPTDRPRPPVQTYSGASRGLLLGPDLTSRLKAFSQSRGVTLYTTLLAAFQTLLFRYTGQPDILVGTPTAGRDRPELASLAGYFVNPVPIRADFSGDPTATELLRDVREKVLAALDHEAFPFSLLIERLQPVRDPSRSPLFNVMFTMQRAPRLGGADLTAFALRESWGRMTLGGLTAESVPLVRRAAQFDLTFTVGEVGSDLGTSLEYNTDLFDDSTIARMLVHYQTLLEGILADPSQRVSALPLLTATERRQLQVTWNDTAHNAPEDVCVHQLIEAQVERTPHAIAVVCGHSWLTYRELNRRANQLARYLLARGAGPQVRVGLCMERSVDVVVGLLAILKAGSAYVPLDPTYPAGRLAAMVHGAHIPILLTHRGLADRLPTEQAHVIALDELWDTIAQEPERNVASGVTADDLMYVIFTSGSTGEPKGAGVYHRGFVNLLHWFVSEFSITAADRALLMTSLSFDLTQKNVYAPLLVGGTLHLLASQQYDPVAIARAIAASRVTLLNCTPSGLYPLVEPAATTAAPAYEDLASLRAVFLGGEPISVPRLADWMASPHCHAELVNTYGPTECTDICAAYRLDRAPRAGTSVVPIGKPIYNVELFILDANLRMLPIGAVGELCIAGAGVGAGYVNDAELTTARFVPHPFSDEPGALLYRTGDLARYRPDGNIEFMGRGDHQVKLRGFRIELGEIEAVLEQRRDVRQAVVIARQFAPGEKRLVAYVVPEGDAIPTHQTLAAHVRAHLPEYMVPAAFMSLHAFPLSPNGKVDRRGLPAPTYTPDRDVDYTAPRTPTERTLAGIWADILGLPRVGIHDNLFEIGGDSILGIQIVARANQAGIHITPSQMYQAQTIVEMAAVAGVSAPAEPRADMVAGAFPLTPIQRWLFEQQLPEPHLWNQALLFDLRQPLDAAHLEAALRHLVAHHDTLRLRFAPEGATWRQWNGEDGADDEAASVTLVDFSALPADEQRRAVQQTAASLRASLSLANGPLMRVALFDLGPDAPSQLLWVIHYLAADGVSWRFLLEDLQRAYQQIVASTPVQLPPSTASYQAWATHLMEYAHTPALLGELDFWCSIPSVRALPTDEASTNTEAQARTLSVALTTKETRALLERAPRALQAKINDILLTALAQALTHWTGSSSALVDVKHHGREPLFDDVDLSRTVGWFTAIYPVHLTVNPSASPRQALRAVRSTLRRVPGHGLGYGILRYLSPVPEITGRIAQVPRAEVCFNYLGQLDHVFSASALIQRSAGSPGPTHSPHNMRPYLIEVTCFIAEGCLQVEWTYGERIHKRATIVALARAFLSSLRALLAQHVTPPAPAAAPPTAMPARASAE